LYPNSEKGDYEEYQEAWELLGPGSDGRGKRIDIQAGAEEFAMEWME
jgi:hypothetical protein